MEEGGDEIEPSLHAAGEGLHRVAPTVGELHGGQRFDDALAQDRSPQAIECAEDPQILLRAQVLVECDALRHEAQVGTKCKADRGYGFTIERDRAGVDAAQARGERHER